MTLSNEEQAQAGSSPPHTPSPSALVFAYGSSWGSTWATWRRSRARWPGKVVLPKEITKGHRGGVAFLSEKVWSALKAHLASKRAIGERMDETAPLFRSCKGRRLGIRRVQTIFAHWQEVAGFERVYNFHTLRHTAITNVYRATKDLFLTQRFARHANPITTVIYTHPSDEELYSAIASL